MMFDMSTPGWYPDPSGKRGVFRYWDGATWSAQTTDDPGSTPAPRNQKNPAKESKSWIIILAVLGLITVLVVLFVVNRTGVVNFGNTDPATEDTNSSKPTISAWDENDESTPPPSPQISAGEMVDCPPASKKDVTAQTGSRLRADNFSMPMIQGWETRQFFYVFAYDIHGQNLVIDSDGFTSWNSNTTIASMANADGFTDIGPSAVMAVECIASSGYYDYWTGTEILTNEQTTVDGHPAWHIRANIYVDMPQFPDVKGDRVDIYVVDLGPGKDHLGLYMGACTIDDEPICELIDQVNAGLQVE
jgi:hypothetical protein